MRIDPAAVAGSNAQTRLSAYRLMVYMLLSVALMVMDQSTELVPRIRNAISYLTEPVYTITELPARALRSVRTYTRSYQSLQDQNQQQQLELLQQQADQQRVAALEQENTRLRALLQATDGRQFDYLFAEMMLVSMDPSAHQVVINRGFGDQVFVGQAVIDGQGVMGQVESVQRGQARVRLISDPDHAIPVQVVRTGQRTVAYGTGTADELELPNLPLQSDVRVDDRLVTSGLGDRFPPGFPVARVSSVNRETGGTFARVLARPLALLDRGREVLLVVPAVAEDGIGEQSSSTDQDSGEGQGDSDAPFDASEAGQASSNTARPANPQTPDQPSTGATEDDGLTAEPEGQP